MFADANYSAETRKNMGNHFFAQAESEITSIIEDCQVFNGNLVERLGKERSVTLLNKYYRCVTDQVAILTHDRVSAFQLESGTELWNVSLADR